MKFNKDDPSLEMSSSGPKLNEVTQDDLPISETTKEKYYCPKCTTLMISFQDTSVQCELLKGTKAGPLLEIVTDINSGSRRGSVQSVTEVMEVVPYNKDVVTIDEDIAPDETVLVTRSFENEAMPQAPRRSSIAVIFNAIKELGTRWKPQLTRSSSEEVKNVDGVDNVGHTSDYQPQLNQKGLSRDDLQAVGNNVHRKSFQLSNGTVVEEETAECNADKAVSTNDDSALGEVNFISRSFEHVQERPSERRESLIEKINPLKLIEKIRKGSLTPSQQEPEEKREETEQQNSKTASSGIRRKSLIPALLVDVAIEEEYKEDARDYQQMNADESEDKAEKADNINLEIKGDSLTSCESPMRYVTSGIRRGSVAAVSAAPPCRDQADASQKEQNQLQSSDNCEENVRLITEGIRRGSVAMVSAAPPCLSFDVEDRRQGLGNAELRVDGEDGLRSGVRRRSLTPATEGSQSSTTSPAREKRVSFEINPEICTFEENNELERERERKSSEAADEFMNRIENRYVGKKPEQKKRKKGAVSLFEQLTGREMGVDYSPIDAKKIQEKLDAEFDEKEKERAAKRTSIPIITFSEEETDESIDITESDHEADTNQVLDDVTMKAEEGESKLKLSDDTNSEIPEPSEV